MADETESPGDVDTLDTLFGHNLWANERLFALCARLADEQLDSAVAGTFGSIRHTLQHIAYAERSYWHRITTGQPYRRPEDAPASTMSELMEWIRASGKGLVEAAPAIRPQDSVEVNWDGRPCTVPKTIILTQAINHATEHRAQILVTLTQLGLQPPDLDSWTYFDAREAR